MGCSRSREHFNVKTGICHPRCCVWRKREPVLCSANCRTVSEDICIKGVADCSGSLSLLLKGRGNPIGMPHRCSAASVVRSADAHFSYIALIYGRDLCHFALAK